MTTLPPVSRALDIEMIRDGGSLAASFADEGGRRYILFTKIRIIDRDELTKKRIGYEQPVLIDCDPVKRPTDTDQKRYSALSGPAIPVTWGQARSLMALTETITEGLNERRRKWLEYMNYVVTNDGCVPPTMEGTMHAMRPA